MKTLLLLLAMYSTTFAQTSIEKSLIGNWSCCGKYNITTAKELIFSKKSSKEISGCVQSKCAYSTCSFENNETGKSFIYCTHEGCKNEISNSDEKIIDLVWHITKDSKTLIISSINKIEYKFSITSITSTQLILKKIN